VAPANPALLADWQKLLLVRDEALKALEADRKAGRIGKALEAKIEIHPTADLAAPLKHFKSSLKELFNVSQVEVKDNSSNGTIQTITVPADGTKCERCWNYYADDGPDRVQTFGSWPKVCGRCAVALEQMGYER
jgi:isoleucyl-tRNA synthetase